MHIFSFLMPYDSGYMSLGNSEIIASCSHIKQSVQTDLLWFLRVNLIFICIFLLMVHILGSIFTHNDALQMPYFIKLFWHLKVTQSFLFRRSERTCRALWSVRVSFKVPEKRRPDKYFSWKANVFFQYVDS